MLSGTLAALSPLRIPLQALAVALAGVAVAWALLKGHLDLALLAVAVVVLLGIACNEIGRGVLPKWPVAANYALQGWLLIPLAVSVIASGAAIVIAVKLALPEDTPTETEKLVSAISTGLVSFLTAAFITWTGDEKDSRLADHVKGAFESKYTRPGVAKAGAHVFAPGSPGELWIYAGEYGGIEGWGRMARLARARGVAKELKSGGSEPAA